MIHSRPDFWPLDKSVLPPCDEERQIGAYSILNHIDLFNPDNNPTGRVLVIHEHPDDLGESTKRLNGNSGEGIACGVLQCRYQFQEAKKEEKKWSDRDVLRLWELVKYKQKELEEKLKKKE